MGPWISRVVGGGERQVGWRREVQQGDLDVLSGDCVGVGILVGLVRCRNHCMVPTRRIVIRTFVIQRDGYSLGSKFHLTS